MGMNKFVLETGPGLSSKIERDGAEYLYLPQGRVRFCLLKYGSCTGLY